MAINCFLVHCALNFSNVCIKNSKIRESKEESKERSDSLASGADGT